jgi:hypothetical protein
MSAHDPKRKVPTPEEFDAMAAKWGKISALLNVLHADMETARHYLGEFGDTAYERRAVVRCFGSYIDGLAVAMREYCFTLCELFGEPANRFLRDKSEERGATGYQRIYTSYRFIAGFMPDSPMARISDSRWDRLHRALDIRNRVMHPAAAVEMEIGDDEIELVLKLGAEFMLDYQQFLEWFNQKQTRIIRGFPGQQRRHTSPKQGRNDLCRCGSGRKYKNCCVAASLRRAHAGRRD